MKILARVLALAILCGLLLAAAFYTRPLWVQEKLTDFHLWREGVHSRVVDLPEGRIHYFEQPATGGNGTPLVLVHGLGGHVEDFAGLMPRFAAQGFHVYAPDLLGYGRSARPASGDYSIHGEEKVVLDFLDAMGLQQPDVVGWSMGGWIVLKLGLDAPQRVRRLAVYDAAGITFHANIEPGLFSPRDNSGVERLVRAMSPTMPIPPDFVKRDIIRRSEDRAWTINRSMAAMRTGQDLLDLRLAGMKPPLLILWGAVDVLIPPGVGETMHALDPRSVLVSVDGCGHFAPIECLTPVTSATVNFLRAEPAQTPEEIHLERTGEPSAPKQPALPQ